MLQELGRLLVQSCRGEDYVARYRDDQFIIVLPNTDAAGTVLVAERIVNTVRVANFLQGHERQRGAVRGQGSGPPTDPNHPPLTLMPLTPDPYKVTVSMGGT